MAGRCGWPWTMDSGPNAEQELLAIDHEQVINDVAVQMGFLDVKEKQKEAILAFLSGKDTFVSLLPTGYRKSLIFALLPRVFNRIKDNKLCVKIMHMIIINYRLQ